MHRQHKTDGRERLGETLWACLEAQRKVLVLGALSKATDEGERKTSVTEVETAAVNEVLRLFTASSVVPNLNGYHNVPVYWFVNRPFRVGQPWPALIAQSPETPGYRYTQAAIAELFTESEAKALAAFLESIVPEAATTITPFKLPVSVALTPLSELDEHEGVIVSICDRDKYTLPFSVSGFCGITSRLSIREAGVCEFIVYKDKRPISRPFADRCGAEAWKSQLLPEKMQIPDLDPEDKLPF